MPTPKRITPWHTFSIAKGNAIQIGGLLSAVALAWYSGREGVRGTRWMVVSRLVAYFSEHAFAHWLVGWASGIRFTGYGLHGTSHPQHYPPGMRSVFSHLPLLSARGDVCCRHRRDRDSEHRDPGLRLAAGRAWGSWLFRRREPVERSAPPQRVAASRR